MKTLVFLLLSITAAYGILTLRKQSYLKFPYNLNNNFGLLRDAAHKGAYHAQERLFYVLGSQSATNAPRLLWVVDMNNPASPQIIHTHSFDEIENGKANDIAICQDTVAVTLESPTPTKEGHVEFFTPYRRGDSSIVRIGRETVGVDPKGLAFTDDCQKLIVANEGRGGQDSVAQQFVDPPGSVTVILRNDISFPAFVNINFETFLAGREATYQSKGVRWVYQGHHNQGIVNKMSDDLEPEGVTISLDQRFAYVSLPENNAIARIDINAYAVNEIFPLGYKNWTNYDIDASDQDGGPNFIRGLPLYSMYQATDIEMANLNGQEYLISANQGQIKRYTAAQGDEFDESRRARTIANDMEFDESGWPAAMKTAVRSNTEFGRLQVRYSDAFDTISRLVKDVTGYGGRSVSLWQTQTMALTYDTGFELEHQENTNYPATFNGEVSNVNQSPTQQRDLRSDDHGAEPTAVGVGLFGTVPLVVVGTRTGLIHLYSDDLLLPQHQSCHREGSATQPWNTLYTQDLAGDALITDIGVINSQESPNGMTLVWVIGSATGSIGIYEVYNA